MSDSERNGQLKNPFERICRALCMQPQDVKRALMGVWLLSGCIGLGCVLLAMLAPAQTVLDYSPQCTWHSQYGVACPACGLTRGFVALAELDIQAAHSLNPAAPWLFGLFMLNGLAALHAGIKIIFHQASGCTQLLKRRK